MVQVQLSERIVGDNSLNMALNLAFDTSVTLIV